MSAQQERLIVRAINKGYPAWILARGQIYNETASIVQNFYHKKGRASQGIEVRLKRKINLTKFFREFPEEVGFSKEGIKRLEKGLKSITSLSQLHDLGIENLEIDKRHKTIYGYLSERGMGPAVDKTLVLEQLGIELPLQAEQFSGTGIWILQTILPALHDRLTDRMMGIIQVLLDQTETRFGSSI